MKVIVVGCGKVGRSITQQLSAENHELAIIDTNSNILTDVANSYDVLGVVGNGASYSVQIEAGIEDADLLIAVTDSDELNLLCCMIAKKAGNCKTMARVRNPIYNNEINFIKEELGLSMTINPEFAAATEIARILRFPSAIKIDTFSKGKTEILEFEIKENSVLDGMSLIEMSKRLKADVLVCGIERGEDVVIPNGSFIMRSGDLISLVASPENSHMFFKEIGVNTNQVKDAMIVGGGKVAYYLACQLSKMGIEIKIIEKSEDRCKELSELLPNAIIINGDATSQSLLIEEGIDTTSAFLPLTGIDEGNIFLSLFARSRTNAKLVTKINRIEFDDIVNTFNLGTIISPKNITAEYILRYVRAIENGRGSNMETLYKVMNKKAEALEFNVSSTSKLVGKTLEEIKLKDNTLLACVVSKGKIIIPNGKTKVNDKDHIIVVTKHTGFNDIDDILI